MEDGQFRKLFEDAYRIAAAAMVVEAKEAAEEAEEEDSVVIPFRIPTSKNLQ
jgi:hypothetical protein